MKHIGTYSKFIVRNGEVCRNEKMSEVFSNMWQQWNLKINFNDRNFTSRYRLSRFGEIAKCGKPWLDRVVNRN